MKTKRLKKLMELMNQLKSDNVEVGYKLFSVDDNEPPTTFHMDDWRCGTAGCAVGWAATNEWFTSRGLTLRSGMIGCPIFDNEENWAAVAKFFKISIEDTIYLFSPYSYNETEVTPSAVAKRIKKYIQAHKTIKAIATSTNNLPSNMKAVITEYESNNGNA